MTTGAGRFISLRFQSHNWPLHRKAMMTYIRVSQSPWGDAVKIIMVADLQSRPDADILVRNKPNFPRHLGFLQGALHLGPAR